MSGRADATLARANRQALELLRAAQRSLVVGQAAEAAVYLLTRVEATLVAGIEQYERNRR